MVAPEVFSELNAMFYSRDAGQEFLHRIDHLSLLACPDEDLAPAYRKPRAIGCMTLGIDRPLEKESRERLLRSEALTTFHHAAETLLRFYFAHVEPDQRCPWMAMAKELNFAEFKKRVATLLEEKRTEAISAAAARVFLGGADPRDAGVALSEEEFADAVDAYARILRYCGRRFLNEAYAYNAAKHGFANLALDVTKLNLGGDGEQAIPLHEGPMITYLSRETMQQPKSGQREERLWCHNLAPALPDYDLAGAILAARGISAISNVGRRRYTGQPGSVVVMTPKQVSLATFAPIHEARAHVNRLTFQLPIKKKDGTIDPLDGRLEGFSCPPDFDPVEKMPAERRVDLIVRQQDRRPLVHTRHSLLPVSPQGSQSV